MNHKEHKGVKYFHEKGVVQSVDPPEAHFGFTYWSLMIPPFKPNSVLMLGAGEETIPKLIKKIYGEKVSVNSIGKYEPYDPIDAFDFVNYMSGTVAPYDYVIIDIFDGDKVPPEVKSETFVKNLATITRHMLAINDNTFHFSETPYQNYFNFALQKKLNNNIVTFLTKEDPDQYFAIKI